MYVVNEQTATSSAKPTGRIRPLGSQSPPSPRTSSPPPALSASSTSGNRMQPQMNSPVKRGSISASPAAPRHVPRRRPLGDGHTVGRMSRDDAALDPATDRPWWAIVLNWNGRED